MPEPIARFLALGDSYTVGEGVPADATWPARVAAAVAGLGAPRILATTGWTTDELAAAMDAAQFTPPYALVTLLIGVNNQYRGRGVDEYRAHYADLLGRAISLAGEQVAHVLCVSIPDWGLTRFARSAARDGAGIGRELDAFNRAAQDLARAAGARWADITPVSRRCGDQADMLAADGLHPSARQYALWAEVITPPARAIMQP